MDQSPSAKAEAVYRLADALKAAGKAIDAAPSGQRRLDALLDLQVYPGELDLLAAKVLAIADDWQGDIDLNISESHVRNGYDAISTVYAYYTPEEKAAHGKHCEHWTEFGHRAGTAPYQTGKERAFIASIAGPQFGWYMISWSDCN